MTDRDEESVARDGCPPVGLAAERTLPARVRTGSAPMGFGFVVARFGLFFQEIAAVRLTPSHVVRTILGIVVNVAAAVRHVRLRHRLMRAEPASGRSGSPRLCCWRALGC